MKIGAGQVLVTGGTGFLGSAVVRALHRRGGTAVVFRRPASNLAWIRGIPHQEVLGDLEDVTPLVDIMGRCDAVIHCAAMTDLATTSEAALERINVQATARLAALCRRAGQPFLYVSSVGTIGPVPGVADETAPFTMTRNRYFASKSRAEQAVLQECRHGLHGLIVNPANMLGITGLSPNQQRLLRTAARRAVCLVPPGGQSFVSVDDVADGILLALARGRPGERYLLGGENLTFAEYAQRVAAVAHHAPAIVRMPPPVFRLAAAMSRLAGPRAASATLRDPSAVAWLSCDAFYSSAKAIAELTYRITPLADVLPAIVAQYG